MQVSEPLFTQYQSLSMEEDGVGLVYNMIINRYYFRNEDVGV